MSLLSTAGTLCAFILHSTWSYSLPRAQIILKHPIGDFPARINAVAIAEAIVNPTVDAANPDFFRTGREGGKSPCYPRHGIARHYDFIVIASEIPRQQPRGRSTEDAVARHLLGVGRGLQKRFPLRFRLCPRVPLRIG